MIKKRKRGERIWEDDGGSDYELHAPSPVDALEQEGTAVSDDSFVERFGKLYIRTADGRLMLVK